jgi:hypothetical protein
VEIHRRVSGDDPEGAPWDTDQVSGQLIFEALAQTAGRRAILRDREESAKSAGVLAAAACVGIARYR